MTDRKPRPRHSTSDHIRRANIADAAHGADAFVSLDWLKGAGASEALLSWADGKCAEVPVGQAWDVVRLPNPAGWEALRHLRALDVPLGPILHTRLGVEVLVPAGSADDWDLPGAGVLRLGEVVGLPHPAVVAPYVQNDRMWVVAPREVPCLTDAADVYGAYAAALASVGGATGAVFGISQASFTPRRVR